ncbi:rhomboid family intramembrane serine protease [Novilysobacter spongiicola]|uniref:Rhomboid family protein n=1 Tax=Lysobacter spongiicola DSM 21749 TaxID=1122188 RepID=A0A1T4LMY4_9GAMM|nr:rhomboid family intramembrane serine protease [Lysobacter spongiicola]MDX1549296.1 rhomboid family intramembrane serine protease [Lysobacter spongiicola]SJZ55986.1 Rhomboid family protein [Lysobacter spongiicola DSM 21749]
MLTLILIAVTVGVTWMAFKNPRLIDRLILWPPAIDRKKQYDRLLTHGFIHADWQHLLFNMITLFFFGRFAEQVIGQLIGPVGYVLFYLSAIVIAILPTYLRHRQDVNYRSLGASGAVSAVLFAFILVQPWSLIFIFFLPVPAIVYGVFFVGYSFWMDRQGGGNTNHNAHLSGAIYGVLFMLLMEPRIGPHFLSALMSPSFG